MRVYADGVLLAFRALASPDQNGDFDVTAADQAILGGKLGGTDPTADFDCNGTVDAADQAFVAAHLGHTCNDPTPNAASSWGRLKLIYR